MSFLTGLVARTIEGSVGIRPRRAARFERDTYRARGVEPLDMAPAAPLQTAPLDAPLAPQPSHGKTAEKHGGTVSQPTPTEMPRAPAEARTRIERIITTPAQAPHPPAMRDTAAIEPAIPAIVAMAPVESAKPGYRRRTDVPNAVPPPAAQPTTTERIERIETIRSIEQRLIELSQEVIRERLIERAPLHPARPNEDIDRSGQPQRATATPPAPMREMASARPARRRTAQALPLPDAAAEPTIEVHIGRVELRATVAPPPRSAMRQPVSARASDASELETYLRRRDGG